MRKIACLLLVSIALLGCKPSGPVKPAAYAGSFYPVEPDILRSTVDTFITQARGDADQGAEGRLLSVLVPHAGYVYSGWVAAYAYKELQHIEGIHTVILVGPSHYVPFTGAAVYIEGSFQTPLGEVPVNEEMAQALINPPANVNYMPEAFAREHSLEVQLPFLQSVLKPGFKIVPILVNRYSVEMYEYLSFSLTEIMKNDPGTLLVISSDLSHYYPYDKAVEMDTKMVEALKRISHIEMYDVITRKEAEIDAPIAMKIGLEVSRRLGATQSVLFKYANSGDVTPQRESVVGYAAIGFYASPYTMEDKREMLRLARESIVSQVRTGVAVEYATENPRLLADGAVFVTIDIEGQLRGCIGHFRPFMPLYQSIIRNAKAACSEDRRFYPMRPDELQHMELEISILSTMVPISNHREIEIGRHGVYLVVENQSALFLPSVPVEFGWDRETMLRELSMKAGLEPEAWKNGQLYVFTAEVFSEEELRGK